MARNILLHLIVGSQNNILKTITRNRRHRQVTGLNKNLPQLKFKYIYRLELGKLMHKIVNNNLSLSFTK